MKPRAPRYRNLRAQTLVLAGTVLPLLLLGRSTIFAANAQWNLTPGSGDWNNADNWTPVTVPNDAADTATFDFSDTTAVSVSANTEVDGIVFNAGASAFTITASPTFTLTISGVGITNNSGIAQNFVSDAFESITFNNSATAGSLTAFTNPGGSMWFYDTSTAANATITNKDSANDSANARGETTFLDNSTAANATITNNDAGSTFFLGASTAGNATLVANGSGGIGFINDSTGGTSRIELFGNGYLTLIHNDPGVAVGSIEGDGNIFLGANNLTVGSNNLSTTFSGVIQDGSLSKIGSGTLTLSGANTYTGATTVSGGLLVITGSLGSTAVTVASGGVLSGTGTINGPLTVSNGGVVDLTGGTFTINNAVTNDGLFILSNGSQLAGVTSFTNNGTLDIITAGAFTPPENFMNNGVILDSSAVQTASAALSGSTFTVTINSYSYHTYQLQESTSPDGNSFTNLGSPEQGSTGNVLTFTDPNATGASHYYRIFVSP